MFIVWLDFLLVACGLYAECCTIVRAGRNIAGNMIANINVVACCFGRSTLLHSAPDSTLLLLQLLTSLYEYYIKLKLQSETIISIFQWFKDYEKYNEIKGIGALQCSNGIQQSCFLFRVCAGFARFKLYTLLLKRESNLGNTINRFFSIYHRVKQLVWMLIHIYISKYVCNTSNTYLY